MITFERNGTPKPPHTLSPIPSTTPEASDEENQFPSSTSTDIPEGPRLPEEPWIAVEPEQPRAPVTVVPVQPPCINSDHVDSPEVRAEPRRSTRNRTIPDRYGNNIYD